jgi:hypothetical protein
MRILGEDARRQFELRVLAHLRAAFATYVGERSDAELLTMIQKGIGHAKNYQVITEADVARYVEYMVLYGPDFDSAPKYSWAGAILRATGITGKQKMDKIDDYDLFLRR